MYGDISAWFYKALAGINLDPNSPGFKHIIIRPRPLGELRWVRAEHNSMYGLIKSSWRKSRNKFTLDVTIPANTAATVYVPAKDAESVTESGREIDRAEAVQFLRTEDGNAVFSIGSGRYRFISKLSK
jgi:alpha-L-rhamnosidase